MRYVRAILILLVAFGMILDIFLQTHIFYGIGVGMLFIWAIEEIVIN